MKKVSLGAHAFIEGRGGRRMKKLSYWALLVILTLSLGACSSSTVSEEEDELLEDEIADEIPVADEDEYEDEFADTDEVPEDEEGEEVEELADTDFEEDESFGEEEDDEFASSDEGDTDLAAAPPTEDPLEEESLPSASSSFAAESSPSYSSGSGEFEDYTVQRGDTLMKIAFEYYGDLYQWRKIYEANSDKISNPEQISVGQVLRVERPGSPVNIDRNGQPYTIQNGDTLGSISREIYGTSGKWRKLYENNRQLIKNPDEIFAGFELYYIMTPQDEAEKEQYLQASPLAGGGQPQFDNQPVADSGAGGGAGAAAQPQDDTLDFNTTTDAGSRVPAGGQPQQ